MEAASHDVFLQNWYIGSQSAFDVHREANGEASPGTSPPESPGTPAPGSEQLASLLLPAGQVCIGGGKFAALHALTAEPPIPQV
jgi:hypothetical protein